MLRFAWRNLINRPVRTALSVLGLSVAIAGMVALFAVSGGIQHLVSRTFERVPGLLIQQQGAPIPLFSSLPAAWKKDLSAIPGVAIVNEEVMVRVNLIEGKRIISPPRFLLGVDIPSRLQLKHGIYDEFLVQGRFLVAEDHGRLNCVVSRQIAEAHQRTIGSLLKVNGTDLTIVGIYDCQSQLLDVNILLDIDTLRRLGRVSSDTVSCFYIEQSPGASNKELKRQIEKTFAGREWKPSGAMAAFEVMTGAGPNPFQQLANVFDRWLKGNPKGVDDDAIESMAPLPLPAESEVSDMPDSEMPDSESTVEVRSAEEWAEQFDEFSGDLNLFLSIISAVGFLIAVLSILNTMLMSVMERIGEFGILRANGWTRHEVMRLVMAESAVIGVTGGILGTLVGTIASLIANQIWPDRLHLHVSLSLAGFSFLMSTLLGILGGLYPAWKASRLSPMEAIRRA